ncbi:MAG: hypothetical protein FGM24_06945 [Candidatus Kapabacteria bacterium]|nr:hypothetical protein [Candidatus Kapabacteria bacterium]
MRIPAWFVVAFLATSTPLLAQGPLPTSPQPVAIVPDRGWVHVLTRAVDVNFNGTQDAGDTVAVWHRFNRAGLDNGTYAFPWANAYTNRPAVDSVNELMYVIVGDSLYALNTAFMVPMVREGWSEGGVAVSLMNDTTAMIAVRNGYTDPGVVRFVHAFTGVSMPMQIEAGVNVQMTKALNDSTVLILSEGNFGAADGTLAIAERSGTTWKSTVLCTGGTPNHFTVHDGKAFVVMNGSHEIVVVDLATRSIISRLSTGTTGYDGPREAVIYDGHCFVTTFTGDVLVFDIATGSRVGRITVDAKPESLAIVDGTLWVTRTYVAGGYAAERNVNIYQLNDATSVATTMVQERASRAILTASDVITVSELTVSDGSIRITDVTGRAYAVVIRDAATSALDIANLPAGTYVVTDGTSSIVLCVRR